MKRIMIAIVALAAAWPAYAEESPITVSPDAIGGSPKIESKSMAGGKMWQLKWRRDDKERMLVLVVTAANAGKRATVKGDNEDLYEMVFKEGLTKDKAEADVREEGDGETDIWGGTAEWILGSELAERNPMTAPLGASSSGKAARGPERNYCVAFTWLADNESKAMGGAYCSVVPAGQTANAEAMLKSLNLSFN